MISNVKAPIWFSEFVKKQFKPLAADGADLKLRMTNVETRLGKVESRFDSLETNINILDRRVTNLETKKSK